MNDVLEPRDARDQVCALTPSLGLVRGDMRRRIPVGREPAGATSQSAAAEGRGDGGGEFHMLHDRMSVNFTLFVGLQTARAHALVPSKHASRANRLKSVVNLRETHLNLACARK